MGKHKKNQASTEEIKQSAIRLIITDGMVTQTGKRTWRVKSESEPDKFHTVRKTNKRIICDCPYRTKRKGASCKHTTAVKMLTLQEAESIKPGEPVTIREIDTCCPKCKSKRFKKNGHA